VTGPLDDLYREVLLDHSKRPRNRGDLPSPPAVVGRGDNPLCGDRVAVSVVVEDGVVSDIRFDGEGCAISTASASVMTGLVRGKTVDEALGLFDRFHAMLASEPTGEDPPAAMAAFEGVRRFPMRVKCATLAWHALADALRAAT